MSKETLTVVRETTGGIDYQSCPVSRVACSARSRSAIALKGGIGDESTHSVCDCADMYSCSHRYRSTVARAIDVAAPLPGSQYAGADTTTGRSTAAWFDTGADSYSQ